MASFCFGIKMFCFLKLRYFFTLKEYLQNLLFIYVVPNKSIRFCSQPIKALAFVVFPYHLKLFHLYISILQLIILRKTRFLPLSSQDAFSSSVFRKMRFPSLSFARCVFFLCPSQDAFSFTVLRKLRFILLSFARSVYFLCSKIIRIIPSMFFLFLDTFLKIIPLQHVKFYLWHLFPYCFMFSTYVFVLLYEL